MRVQECISKCVGSEIMTVKLGQKTVNTRKTLGILLCSKKNPIRREKYKPKKTNTTLFYGAEVCLRVLNFRVILLVHLLLTSQNHN